MRSKTFGWRSVFKFTFVQLLKNKSLIIMTLILMVLSFVAMQFAAKSLVDNKTDSSMTIWNLYIRDDTGLDMEKWLDLNKMEYEGMLPMFWGFTTESDESIKEMLDSEDGNAAAVICIDYDDSLGMFSMTGIYGENGDVDSDDLEDIIRLISDNFQKQMMSALNVTEEQMEYINSDVDTEVKFYTVSEAGESEIKPQEDSKKNSSNIMEYSFAMMTLCLSILMIALSGEQVATSVAQEKCSKVVEYLMTSVKPLALLLGKILAVFLFTIAQIVLFVGSFFASAAFAVASNPDTISSVGELIQSAVSSANGIGTSGRINFNMTSIPFIFVIFMAGLLFYAVLAALAGASVSKMEELTEGMKLFTLTMLMGAYGSMIVMMGDLVGGIPDALRILMEMLPITAPFLDPAYLISGRMSLLEGVCSTVLILVFLALIVNFAARVYESLIYYNGTKIKIKQLLMMGREETADEK